MTFTVNKMGLLGGVTGVLIVAAGMATNGGQLEKQPQSVTTTQVTDQSVADPSLQAEVQRLKKLLASEQSLLRNQTVELQRLTVQLANHDDDSGIEDLSEDDIAEMMQVGETEEQAWADESMAVLDEALSKETMDPEWSPMASDSIHEILAKEAFKGSQLVETSCSATLCRVETRQNDMQAVEQLMSQFSFEVDWASSAFAKVISHEEGGQTVVYYLSRDGYSLPYADS